MPAPGYPACLSGHEVIVHEHPRASCQHHSRPFARTATTFRIA